MHYKPGSIRRVILKNFLTYSDVDFCPGPRLNIVMGPNGTGKSTILCAICLGLGGGPTLLGRADDARTFIMHEKDVAEIEIELSPNLSEESRDPITHRIKRIIDRNRGKEKGKGAGASTYYINGQPVNLKKVQKLVNETYSISIDNLCTFLPQDKVGSFSGFDSKMLLQETEKSLSGTKYLYKQHLDLIELEKDILSHGSNLTSHKEKLSRLEEEFKRLEREKGLMEEREKLLKEIKLLEQKHAWVQFDQTREHALQLKNKKKVLKGRLSEARKSLEPIKNSVGVATHNIDRVKSHTKDLDRTIQTCRKQYDAGLKKAEKFQDEIETEALALSSIDSLQRRAEQAMEEKSNKLEQMQANLNQFPSEDGLEMTYTNSTDELRELKKRLQQAKREVEKTQSFSKETVDKRDGLSRKFKRMCDDKARRNEKIFRANPKLHETYKWIQHNGKEFRRPVSGPIVCEISPKDANVAAYIESHVSKMVMKSYVVECKSDYNLLYREIREKKKLPINIIVIEQGELRARKQEFSDEKMDVLRKDHGVLGYLDEGFDAPDPIREALRESSRVHNVLVGGIKTQSSIDTKKLLDYLSQQERGRSGLKGSCIIAMKGNESHKYTSQISRYSGKSSLRVDGPINPARMLSAGVSPAEKEFVEKELQEATNKVEELKPGVDEASKVYSSIQSDGQQVQLRQKDARKAIKEVQDAKKKVLQAERKLKEAEEEASKDNEIEKKQHIQRMKSHVSNSVSALEKSSSQYDEWMKTICSLAGLKITEEGLLEKARKLREYLAEREIETEVFERDLSTVTTEFNQKKKELGQLKVKASESAPIKDDEGNELPLKAQLDELPDDISELEDAIDDSKDKINSIHDNPEVLRKYEEQKKEITELRERLETHATEEDAKRDQLLSLKTPWEASLTNTVKKVNVLFAAYMSELDCAGEISLIKSSTRKKKNGQEENLGDFENWGIEIKVKFRATSELQVLSAQVQSGGERSVSTIMYLMALQDLMVSPFRCVDEINQGLDERNERLVFTRIVKNSTKSASDINDPSSHSGQYFLITPKLLPNLTDMDNDDITILCIFNGPHNFKHSDDWNVSKFVNSRKRWSSESSGCKVEDIGESLATTVPRKKHRKNQ